MITTLRYTFHLFETTITHYTDVFFFYNISTGPIGLHRMKNVCMHIFLFIFFFSFFSDTELSRRDLISELCVFQNGNEKHYGEIWVCRISITFSFSEFRGPGAFECVWIVILFFLNKPQILENKKYQSFWHFHAGESKFAGIFFRCFSKLISTSQFHYVSEISYIQCIVRNSCCVTLIFCISSIFKTARGGGGGRGKVQFPHL